MLWKSNIVAVVGSTNEAKMQHVDREKQSSGVSGSENESDSELNMYEYRPNVLVLYDLEKNCILLEFRYQENIKNCKLTQKRLIVSTSSMVYVYELFRGKDGAIFPLMRKDPTKNPYGLLTCSTIRNEKENIRFVYCFPHPKNSGYVCINYETEKKHFVKYHVSAHSTAPVFSIALSCDGRKLATSSTHGTVIRIFNVLTGKETQLLRRGSEFAKVYAMSFRGSDNRFLVCSSDKPTIHIFEISKDKSLTRNRTNFLRNGEYSFCTYRNPSERNAMAPSLPFFAKDGTHVYVLSTEKKGVFHIKFDSNAKVAHEGTLVNYKKFM